MHSRSRHVRYMEIIVSLIVVTAMCVYVTWGERRDEKRIKRWFDRD